MARGKAMRCSVDPMMPAAVQISLGTAAGPSDDFAQHIRNHFIRRGCNYLITELALGDLSG